MFNLFLQALFILTLLKWFSSSAWILDWLKHHSDHITNPFDVPLIFSCLSVCIPFDPYSSYPIMSTHKEGHIISGKFPSNSPNFPRGKFQNGSFWIIMALSTNFLVGFQHSWVRKKLNTIAFGSHNETSNMALPLYSEEFSNGQTILFDSKLPQDKRTCSNKWNSRHLKLSRSHRFCKRFGLNCSNLFSGGMDRLLQPILLMQ